MPARAEEVKHAKEEGIQFRLLTNSGGVFGRRKGLADRRSCVRMELGEAGRKRPPQPGGDTGLGVRHASASWPSSDWAPRRIR